jgi:hypothetical protein
MFDFDDVAVVGDLGIAGHSGVVLNGCAAHTEAKQCGFQVSRWEPAKFVRNAVSKFGGVLLT